MTRIAVFNSFDITPAENGGEIRMLSLYGPIAQSDDVRIISYDLRGKAAVRRETLPNGLRIIDCKVDAHDRDMFFQIRDRIGLHIHDILCIDDYLFSPNFLRETTNALAWADVVIASHPYMATTIFPRCSSLQLKVLEAHNVEVHVKQSFFAPAWDRALADQLLANTLRSERYALETADLVVAVGGDDRRAFIEEYGIDGGKIHVVPNGVSVASYDAVPNEACAALRTAISLSGETDVGVFLGSAYGPNVDSYRTVRTWLADSGFTGTVLVIGKIVDAYDDSWPPVPFTEQWVGFVDDKEKSLLVKSADFLLQIMTSGGGTNLKLFDYMASGVPIVANALGRRGIDGDGWCLPAETPADLAGIVRRHAWRSDAARTAAKKARAIVLRDFEWRSIAQRYRVLLS